MQTKKWAFSTTVTPNITTASYCTYIHTKIRTYTHTHTHTHTHTYIHTYIHVHTYTYLHTHALHVLLVVPFSNPFTALQVHVYGCQAAISGSQELFVIKLCHLLSICCLLIIRSNFLRRLLKTCYLCCLNVRWRNSSWRRAPSICPSATRMRRSSSIW